MQEILYLLKNHFVRVSFGNRSGIPRKKAFFPNNSRTSIEEMSEYLHIKFTIPEDLGLKMKNIRAVK